MAARSPQLPLLSLLRAAVADHALDASDVMDADTMLWAIEGGLAPLLCRLTPGGAPHTASPVWPAVIGAELTARMRCEMQLQALEDVLDACAGRVPPLTLLKGASLGTERYAAPSLRPMGDLDVLVDADCLVDVERIVRELGYRPVGSPAAYRGHHHITPLVHPDTEVWIEVHHALFPAHTALGADAVFGVPSVRAERRSALFRGRPVHHLSTELQLVYLPAHWAVSAKLLLDAAGLRSMLDTMLLLRDASAVRWPTVLAWLDGAAAASQVYLLLAYLDARQLATPGADVIDGMRRRQRSFDRLSLRLAFELLDRYVVDGRSRGRIMSDRTLALIWRALLERGGWSRKAACVASQLRDKLARDASRLFGAPG